jgi:hypothetical protein
MHCGIQWKKILTGMKDPMTDLWTLPIIGSAGKTSQMDTHDKQNAFDNLRDEFLERANVAHSTVPSSLAVPLCASTQACATGQKTSCQIPTQKILVCSHILSEPRPTASSSRINCCVAQQTCQSSKRSNADSLTDAPTSQPKEYHATSTRAQPPQKAT